MHINKELMKFVEDRGKMRKKVKVKGVFYEFCLLDTIM